MVLEGLGGYCTSEWAFHLEEGILRVPCQLNLVWSCHIAFDAAANVSVAFKTLLHIFVRRGLLMWRHISDRLREYPGRQKVAKALVELGLSIRDSSTIYCGGIELSDVKIARFLGVDRRTVRETAELISF